MKEDTKRMRGNRPFVMGTIKTGDDLDEIIAFIESEGLLVG